MDKLQRLKDLYEDGHLTEDEYTARKNELIDQMLDGGGAQSVSPPQQAAPIPSPGRATSTTSYAQAPPATTAAPRGRVVVANAPPPGGRVIYVDVNQPAVATHTTKAVLTDKDGRLICTRCGQSITTRVMEIQRKPYDTVCFRIEQMGDAEIKMPNTAMAEAPPVRSYVNRKGERELAAVAKKNAEYDKKFGNKDAKRAKEQIARLQAREQAAAAKKK